MWNNIFLGNVWRCVMLKFAIILTFNINFLQKSWIHSTNFYSFYKQWMSLKNEYTWKYSHNKLRCDNDDIVSFNRFRNRCIHRYTAQKDNFPTMSNKFLQQLCLLLQKCCIRNEETNLKLFVNSWYQICSEWKLVQDKRLKYMNSVWIFQLYWQKQLLATLPGSDNLSLSTKKIWHFDAFFCNFRKIFYKLSKNIEDNGRKCKKTFCLKFPYKKATVRRMRSE